MRKGRSSTRLTGKAFYKKMLDAKAAKAAKAKREVIKETEETPKEKGDVLHSVPERPKQRLEATAPTFGSKMDEQTNPASALDKALSRIREQARGL